jgi:excinuclease ABC subunit B
VGINLLREGLDMPEVSLVAILDSDKEGFLRSDRSFIQTIGRAARNINGKAILYADKITGSMQRAMDETDRRRQKQIDHNTKHGIVPQALVKSVSDIMEGAQVPGSGSRKERNKAAATREKAAKYAVEAEGRDIWKTIELMEKQMFQAAKDLEFEVAANLRDQIEQLKKRAVSQ